MKIILASASPRRQQLLRLAGIPHEVIVSNADETISGEPDTQVKELALRKAKAVRFMLNRSVLQPNNAELPKQFFARQGVGDDAVLQKIDRQGGVERLQDRSTKPAIIIAADTLVYIDGKVLGKPNNKEEAFEMLKKLSGRKHTVYTGVAVLGESEISFVDAADVFFHTLSDDEINAYIATGEPFDKAGAYGVQERGAFLVERIEGDFYTVVGLPVSRVCRALAKLGYDIWKNGGADLVSGKENISGVGVDIIKIERFENISARFMERIFTEREREYLSSKKTQSTAGIFAAKEAVAKAMGTGFRGFSPKDIEILHNENGLPYVVLHNSAKINASIYVSISHTSTDAIAYAVKK